MKNGSTVLDRTANTAVPQSLIDSINAPARAEMDREGGVRGLLSGTNTLDASDLCPGQGVTAATGFITALSNGS